MTVELGPVPSDLVVTWTANSRQLVEAVRRRPHIGAAKVDQDILDYCDLLLDVWEARARQSVTFEWSMEVEPGLLLVVVKQWLAIGSLSDHDLAELGCTWAPPETRPFADALVNGVIDALESLGGPGRELLSTLRET